MTKDNMDTLDSDFACPVIEEMESPLLEDIVVGSMYENAGVCLKFQPLQAFAVELMAWLLRWTVETVLDSFE